MTETNGKRTPGEEFGVSLIRDDLFFRLQRKVGLIPPVGLGLGRRVVFWPLVAWLPIVLWAALNGRAGFGGSGESLFEHFAINVRCLVAMPLFILAEGMVHQRMVSLLPYFVRSGIVREEDRPRMREVLESTLRLRNASLPWVMIIVIVFAWSGVSTVAEDTHELVWALQGEGVARHLGFGGWWFLYVARPAYLILLLAWLWRVILCFILFRRLSKLSLALVPTHPDRVGGLGFLDRFAAGFSPVVLGFSAVTSSFWAHQVLYHGVSLQSLRMPMAAFLVLVLVVFLAPLIVFVKPLGVARKQALLEYGMLVAKHGRLVKRRWILNEEVNDEGLLSAPEIGPVADTLALYEAVQKMRLLPVGKASITSIALPAVLPLLAVLSIRIPLASILQGLLKALM